MAMLEIKAGKKKLRIKDCKGAASLRGLMFDSMHEKDGALIYSNNIWMPFVRHELDLFFLDAQMRVVKKERAVPLSLKKSTWKIYKCEGAKYCLEVKASTVKEKITKVSTVPSKVGLHGRTKFFLYR